MTAARWPEAAIGRPRLVESVPPPPPDIEPLDEMTARTAARERPGCNGPFNIMVISVVIVAIAGVAAAYAYAHGWRGW